MAFGVLVVGVLDVRPQIVDMQVAGAVLLASLLSRFVPLRILDNRSLYHSFPLFLKSAISIRL